MPVQSYTVTGMSCDHCKAAVTAEVSKVPGVESLDVELGLVRVSGTLIDDAAVLAAIDEAGYDAAPA